MIEEIKFQQPNIELISGNTKLRYYHKKTIINKIKFKILEFFFPIKVKWLK